MSALAWALLAAAAALAAADWLAVAGRSKPVEYVTKPAVMVALIGAIILARGEEGE